MANRNKPIISEGKLHVEDLEAIVDAIPNPGAGISVSPGNVWNAKPGDSPNGISKAWTETGATARDGNKTGKGNCFLTTIIDDLEYRIQDSLTQFHSRSVQALPAKRYLVLERNGDQYFLISADCEDSEKPPLIPEVDPPDPPDPPDPANPNIPTLDGGSMDSSGESM